MPFIDRKENRKRWEKMTNGGFGSGLKESLQGKKLHMARKLLRTAMDSGEGEHVIAAIGALLELPEDDHDKALNDINKALAGCKGGSPEDIMRSHVLSFVLMKLHENGWAMLDSWDQTQPLLEDHSELVSNSLVMGFMNGEDLHALETLGFLASCGAYCYNADSLERILTRFLKKPGAALPFYKLTEALAEEGPEELQQVADEMEEKRVSLCKEGLNYATDRQFVAASELITLVMLGRDYLAPVLDEIKGEMLELMQDPAVYPEEYDDPDKTAEEEARVKQRRGEVRTNAAGILRQLQDIGMPISVKTDGKDPKELKRIEKMSGRLAAFGVELYIEVEGGELEEVRKALGKVPPEHIGPALVPEELSAWMGIALHPEGETTEELEANRSDAIAKLKEAQEAGAILQLTLEVSAAADSEAIVAELLPGLVALEQNGVQLILNLTGDRAEEVNELLGFHRELLGYGQSLQDAVTSDVVSALLQTVMFPYGEDEAEAESGRQAAIEALKDLQEGGTELMFPVDCPAETDPAEMAAMLSQMLHELEAEGVDVALLLTGERSEEVSGLMGLTGYEG